MAIQPQPNQQLAALPEMNDRQAAILLNWCLSKDKEEGFLFNTMLAVAACVAAIGMTVISGNFPVAAALSAVCYLGSSWIYEQFRNHDYNKAANRLETADFRTFMAQNRIRAKSDFILAAYHRYEKHIRDINTAIAQAPVRV